ncbi:MAG: hypothetical protein J6K58_13695 [Lachnospiraceae bacterium]|nr:hypothetical protein [Lachnospiraceae bacterium]
MKQNIKCTIEDVIDLVKDKYLKEGEPAVYADNDWHIYEADEELLLTTPCCVTAPPEFDDETDEEIIPDFAVANGMDRSIVPDIFQDVIINALRQKSDVTNEELVKALNYYLDKDTFMKL